jgi:transcriptional regulator with XRE-family HTH domain
MDLRTYRQTHGLTLSQMGELIGVSHSTVQRLEAGRMLPSATLMRRIAEATGHQVTPNDLVLAQSEQPA